MKKILTLFVLFIAVSSFAQTYFFEGSTVPTAWLSSASESLSVSTEHFKEGIQSLCWTSSGTDTLRTTLSGFTAGSWNGAYLQIYSPEITNDTLIVEFLNFTTVVRKAVFLINYKGWREFNRAYTEYASTTSVFITAVRFSLKPTSATSVRKIYFDDVQFNRTNDSERIIGSHWVLDRSYFNSTASTASLQLFANPVDIPVVTPTNQELTDLNLIRSRRMRSPTAGTTTELNAAKAYVASLNIVRNPDGSVRGNVIDCSAAALTDAFMTNIAKKAEVLAAAAQNDSATKILLQDFVAHLLDQGISEGCNYRLFSNSYTPCKEIPAAWLDAMTQCTADQKIEILKLVKWFSFYGRMYYPQDKYLANNESDIVYLFLPHMLGIALNQPDDATAVRELKAFKRFLDRNTEYVPGDKDILKPDGTGFHHRTHYNNYMYSYKTWLQHIYSLNGTQFRIATDSYQRFKKAIISVYIMGTQDTGDARFFANSLSGRKPFDESLQFSKQYFENLIAIGADCLGVQDDELAAAYNYFFKTTKYTVPAHPYEGFYQFNYSPLGIYRKGNWVASMRSPTSKFFGAEIYDKANRFGRYQSNGTLEIMYSGTLAKSGYPSGSSASGGWDWNVVPGATTVHYTSWLEMMPLKSVSGRFDQRTKTKNFAGALSFGDCGIFACDFDQVDSWGGKTAFTATNLVFKKSMFAFDNMIISLGSDISSSGSYPSTMITATNLFQSIVSTGTLNVNGTPQISPYTATISPTSDNWMVTPLGTGYFVPAGNNSLEIRYGSQTSPKHDGSDYAAPKGTVTAAKAYLNHGVKPGSKSYSFVVVPATNSADMQTLATSMANGGGSIYQIHAQNSAVHALTYKPLNITAYSFFGAASDLSFGIIKSSSAENLLMDHYDSTNNRHYFAICNPNLKPVTAANYNWIASPTKTTLTLEGEWIPINPVSGVSFSAPSGGQTVITISMSEGEPIYFGVKMAGDHTAIKSVEKNEWVQVTKTDENLHLLFSELPTENVVVNVFTTTGQLIYSHNVKNRVQLLDIPTATWQSGLLICTVQNGNATQIFKWLN